MNPHEESSDPPAGDDPVEALMAQCLELDEDARPARLAELCSAYPELATELRERFELLLDMGIEVTRSSPARDTFPDRLGGFRLLERLGGGGMGVVFRAEEEALGREVALKLIRPEHLYFPKSRERFRREVEAVARLSHPGVVPVYSVGEEAGIPYFAMELVRGATLADVLHRVEGRAPESLTGEDLLRVVDPDGAHALATSDGSPYAGGWIEACLHVVKCVAEALVHAHAHNILHRDIKPSNIALSRDGRPMLLDFGLTSSSDEERATRTGTQLGTLPYMSPEQVRGSSEIDARTDVYSLGVTLYELLALQVPYRAEDRSLTEALILAARPDPLRARNRRVSSEIEVVCLKAMDPDGVRRYATAADFARDIGNLLAHRPIEARPAGPWLRAKRWTQRNPARATALVLGLAMLAGVPSALFVQQRAHAKDLQASLERIKDEVTTADAVLNFVLGLLGEASPDRSRGEPLSVIDLLKRAHDRITPDEFKEQPLVRARLLAHLGQVDVDVGLYQQGLRVLQEASSIYRSQPAADPREFALALSAEAKALRIMGDNEGAAAVAREAHERWSDLEGAQSVMAATTLGDLAILQFGAGKIDAAEASMREAIGQMRALGSDAETELAILLSNFANMLTAKPSLDEAQDLSREALSIQERLHDEPHLRIAAAQNSLALTLKLSGRLDEAQALYEQANAQWRALYPKGSEELSIGLSNAGQLYLQRADFARAEEFMRESLAIARRVFPADHPQIEALLDILCNMLCRRHRFREAAPLLDELLPMRVRLHGEDAWNLRPAAQFAAMGLKGEYPDEQPIQLARRLVVKIWPALPETDAHLVFALHVVGNAAQDYGHGDFSKDARRVAKEIQDHTHVPADEQQ